MVRLLRNRLSLTDLLRRYPEISDIEIDRPLIVVGMPRSGTTHLVNLIARGPAPPRPALLGEPGTHPGPRPGARTRPASIPRYARAKAEHEALMASAPYVAAMHDQFPEAIEEEVELLDLDLAVLCAGVARPGAAAGGTSTSAWTRAGTTPTCKTVLQALTFLRGPRTWVLKSPQHAEQLGPLMATFPDATVAFTHRDPVAVIQSGGHDDGLLRPDAPHQHRPASG